MCDEIEMHAGKIGIGRIGPAHTDRLQGSECDQRRSHFAGRRGVDSRAGREALRGGESRCGYAVRIDDSGCRSQIVVSAGGERRRRGEVKGLPLVRRRGRAELQAGAGRKGHRGREQQRAAALGASIDGHRRYLCRPIEGHGQRAVGRDTSGAVGGDQPGGVDSELRQRAGGQGPRLDFDRERALAARAARGDCESIERAIRQRRDHEEGARASVDARGSGRADRAGRVRVPINGVARGAGGGVPAHRHLAIAGGGRDVSGRRGNGRRALAAAGSVGQADERCETQARKRIAGAGVTCVCGRDAGHRVS